jgi:hypothetical protein
MRYTSGGIVTAVTAVVTTCVRKKAKEVNVVTAVTTVTTCFADGCGWGEGRRHRWSFSPKRKEKSYLSLGGGDSGDSLEKPSLLAVTAVVTSGDKAVTNHAVSSVPSSSMWPKMVSFTT